MASGPQNYYVAPNGNPGDVNHPWCTIQHAADTMVAGDTVLIRSGTYQFKELLVSIYGDSEKGKRLNFTHKKYGFTKLV
jgi:hypothetical protein